MKPEYVAPLVVALCSEKPPANGQLYEAGTGWFAATRWQRTRGVDFEHEKGVPSVEDVAKALTEICNFDNGQADNPESPQDGSRYTMGNVLKNPRIVSRVPPSLLHCTQERSCQHRLTHHARLTQAASVAPENRANRKHLSAISSALAKDGPPSAFTYTSRDVILYALSIGATRHDLPLVYERSPTFHALPTFAIVPTYFSKGDYDLSALLPNFDRRKLLHGEQYLEIRGAMPAKGASLETRTKLVEVLDKGKAALVRRAAITIDKETGREVAYNESVSFVRGAGGFGGARTGKERGAATAENKPPAGREERPDAVVECPTGEQVAALYRLLGDRNPLHVDPEFARGGGLEEPILHGLATLGICVLAVMRTFGGVDVGVKSVKVRFAGTVKPGETVVVEMWKAEVKKIVFRAKVKENGKPCISGGGVELASDAAKL
jgi:multifunctional beta-oxidation protein